MLQRLAFPEEVRRVEEAVPARAVPVEDQALQLARALIDRMTVPFAAERYRDDCRDALRRLIESKVEAGVDAARVPAPVSESVADLMALLPQSVAQAAAPAGAA